MTEIRDFDVRYALEKVVGKNGFNLESEVNLPYKSARSIGHIFRKHVDRKTYDKVYTIDGLTVSLQAEMGRIERGISSKNIRDYLVTDKESVVGWQEMKRILNHDDSDTLLGPIVDSVDDIKLETINVKNVLVQYTGLTLENLDKFSDFISGLKGKYGLEILSKNDGIVYSDLHPLQFSGSLADVKRVFSKKIYKRDELETGITSVYAAGKTLAESLGKK
nr:hypothetical protein [Candidatus Woesearchaeota archaeon]